MKKNLKKEVGKAAGKSGKVAKNDCGKKASEQVEEPAIPQAQANIIKEFHLFAGIGGGIYGGELLGHQCCGGVEIMPYAQGVLRQRQEDGWMPKFPIYGDLCALQGNQFRGTFDVLCGGFPCQAFSTAAHGNNIASKNLWGEMFRFVQESNAPIVFGENVVLRALNKAKEDLEGVGYTVEVVRLSCSDIGADHQRNRFWLLAYNDNQRFQALAERIQALPRLSGRCWEQSPEMRGVPVPVLNGDRRDQLLGVGNAQSPFAAATAFRILVNRHLNPDVNRTEIPSEEEISAVFEKRPTWIQGAFNNIGLVHTPTTMANYACPSMMKHQGCRNFAAVFGHPEPVNAEYLMGFPLGASSPNPQGMNNVNRWRFE
jgi:site-specific DNA-cytosine methylase